MRIFTGRHERVGAPPRVGLFGLFGSGNIGNDGSLQAMLTYLNAAHPDAIVDMMCQGPARIRSEYGIEAIASVWSMSHADRPPGVAAGLLRVLGKVIDVFRTASWVRRHDVVIVPGTGILEDTLPLRPWQTPYELFLVCAFSRLFRTKVALVSVGANKNSKWLTRHLFTSSARFAFYRSYRDTQSRDAMRRGRLRSVRDPVYPDLAFALPAPAGGQGASLTVGVGLMNYHGGTADRQRAAELHASYVAKMKYFIGWLVDGGRTVRLFTGDGADDLVVQEVLADLRASRPDLDPTRVVAEPISSLSDLMRQMAAVDTVVATRFHNVLCALKLAKPTVSIGYAVKNAALMTELGLSEFCQFTSVLDVDRLIEQFTELESRSAELRPMLRERSAAYAQLLDQQFAVLSALLFPARTELADLAGAPAAERVTLSVSP
jgi:polysaccharide pyruvyl transferase WcaK-like protein